MYWSDPDDRYPKQKDAVEQFIIGQYLCRFRLNHSNQWFHVRNLRLTYSCNPASVIQRISCPYFSGSIRPGLRHCNNVHLLVILTDQIYRGYWGLKECRISCISHRKFVIHWGVRTFRENVSNLLPTRLISGVVYCRLCPEFSLSLARGRSLLGSITMHKSDKAVLVHVYTSSKFDRH